MLTVHLSQVEKIHVLGARFQPELLAQIPAENLPKQFGGTCECEGGCELSDAGPWNEEKYVFPAQEKPAIEAGPEPTATSTAAPPEPEKTAEA